MIARFTAKELRQMADQLDAQTMMKHAGADHLGSNTVLRIEGHAVAYFHWWQHRECYMAEIISFTPGTAEPLVWHDADHAVTEG